MAQWTAPPPPQELGTLMSAGRASGQRKRAFWGRDLRMAYLTGHSLHNALSNVPEAVGPPQRPEFPSGCLWFLKVEQSVYVPGSERRAASLDTC